jgi:hypothetical protein
MGALGVARFGAKTAQLVANGGVLKPSCPFGIFLPKGGFDGLIIFVPARMGHEPRGPKTT